MTHKGRELFVPETQQHTALSVFCLVVQVLCKPVTELSEKRGRKVLGCPSIGMPEEQIPLYPLRWVCSLLISCTMFPIIPW